MTESNDVNFGSSFSGDSENTTGFGWSQILGNEGKI